MIFHRQVSLVDRRGQFCWCGVQWSIIETFHSAAGNGRWWPVLGWRPYHSWQLWKWTRLEWFQGSCHRKLQGRILDDLQKMNQWSPIVHIILLKWWSHFVPNAWCTLTATFTWRCISSRSFRLLSKIARSSLTRLSTIKKLISKIDPRSTAQYTHWDEAGYRHPPQDQAHCQVGSFWCTRAYRHW